MSRQQPGDALALPIIMGTDHNRHFHCLNAENFLYSVGMYNGRIGNVVSVIRISVHRYERFGAVVGLCLEIAGIQVTHAAVPMSTWQLPSMWPAGRNPPSLHSSSPAGETGLVKIEIICLPYRACISNL
jgi:hypothetical protein